MFNENLVQWCTVDIHPTECGLLCSECVYKHSARACPRCSSQLQYGYGLDLDTGSFEPFMRCCNCDYTE